MPGFLGTEKQVGCALNFYFLMALTESTFCDFFKEPSVKKHAFFSRTYLSLNFCIFNSLVALEFDQQLVHQDLLVL
jgi:hypothetical protein